MGRLYVVGTPIGNLEDLSPRAKRILSEVDFIAAEDTRVTGGLLNHFGIKKPMLSYYAHNLRARGEEILVRLEAGENCAIVTDAGMPCISDPGEELVALCASRGVEVEVVPGPSAVLAALAVAGIGGGRFAFEGFLSVNRPGRAAHLEEVRNDRRTLVFYEAPHKLCATLEDLAKTFGERRVAVVKELTKLHETVLRTTLPEAAVYYRAHPPKGEYVLVVEGAPEKPPDRMPLSEAAALVRAQAATGVPMSKAAKEVASLTGYAKSALYTLALKETEEE